MHAHPPICNFVNPNTSTMQHNPHIQCYLEGSLLDTALLEALIDAKGNALGNGSPDAVDVLAGDALSEGGSDQIVGEGESLVNNLTGTEVFSCESSYEGGRVAIGVILSVYTLLNVNEGNKEFEVGINSLPW